MTRLRIAFIGLGAMGIGMASRLAEAGFDLTVYNRTRSKSEQVGRLGARVADAPADAAREADLVMLSLPNHRVVSDILHGDRGVFGSLPLGGYIADLTTVPPAFAQETAQRAAAAGYHALDACILGNYEHARQGELRFMVGGDEADFHAIEEVLHALGKEVTHLGRSGLGATMKLTLNMLMGIEMQALAEAVSFGERAGLPRDTILQLISRSGYSAPVMRFKCGVMQRRAFERADFKLALMRKDMMLVLSEAQSLAVPMPVSEGAYTMLTAAEQQGLGDHDCASILAFMERVSGLGDYPWPGEPANGIPVSAPVQEAPAG